MQHVIHQWFSKFFSYSPLQTQTLSISPQQKSQKGQLQKFHTTYCENTVDDYEPNRLFITSVTAMKTDCPCLL